MGEFVSDGVENNVGKGENAGYHIVFKTIFLMDIKTGYIVW